MPLFIFDLLRSQAPAETLSNHIQNDKINISGLRGMLPSTEIRTHTHTHTPFIMLSYTPFLQNVLHQRRHSSKPVDWDCSGPQLSAGARYYHTNNSLQSYRPNLLLTLPLCLPLHSLPLQPHYSTLSSMSRIDLDKLAYTAQRGKSLDQFNKSLVVYTLNETDIDLKPKW